MANHCSGCGKFVANGSHSVFIPDSDRSSESLDFYCNPCFEDNRQTYNRIVYGHPEGQLALAAQQPTPHTGGESTP